MAQLDLTLLGSFSAAVSDEQITEFRTDKMRALLAYLALNAGRPFRREILATLLWAEWSDSDARRNLRQTLHRTIQLVNQISPELGEALVSANRQTIQLNSPAVILDVDQFRQYLQAAEDHSHSHLFQCEACLRRLQQAAALYKGHLLEGFEVGDAVPFDEWLSMEREQLQQQALELFSKLASAFEWQTNFSKVHFFANQQLNLAPWRESAHRQLMRVYSMQGKRSEALAQYMTCCRLLEEELGVGPSPETVHLWNQIKDGKFETAESPPPASATFPAQLTPFVGRKQEINEIVSVLVDEDCRLLTLIGPGGIGKTRLAIQIGRELAVDQGRFQDGVYFVPLVDVTDSSMLVNAIAQQLGIKLTMPVPPRQQLLDYLEDKGLLLVCDNFEQVENGPAFLGAVMSRAPEVQLLVTSRQPLGLTDEYRQVVNGLDYGEGEKSEAVLLFQRNAKRVEPHFQLDDTNMTAVLDLCRLVDGMPLALEIAASWTRMMDCPTILQETQRSLDFLTAPMDDFPERHRSVQAVLAQSWQMLSGRVQNILGQLARFGGTFTLEAATAIVEELSTLDIAALLDKSLLKWQPNGRYQIHALLGQFVRNQPFEEPDSFWPEFGRYFLGFVARQEAIFRGDNPPRAIAAIQSELANIRLAWRWAVEQKAEGLLGTALDGLLAYYEFRGAYVEGSRQFKLAGDSLPPSVLVDRLRLAEADCLQRLGELAAATALVEGVIAGKRPETELAALIVLAKLNEQQSEFDTAVALLQKAQTLAHPLSREAARIWSILGSIYRYRGPMEDRIDAHKQALAVNVALEDRLQTAECHNMLSMIYKDLGEYDEAVNHIEQALAIAEDMNHRENISRFLQKIGVIYWRREDLNKAKAYYESSLKIATEINHKRLISICSGSLGILYKRNRDYDKALSYYWRAVQLGKEIGDKSTQAVYMGNIGNVYMDLGQYERAIDTMEQAAELDRSIGALGGVARHQGNMGDAYKYQGQYQAAVRCFEIAIGPLRETGATYFLCWVLVSYAECLFALGRFDEARRANEEGGRLAAEIGRDFYQLLSLVLEARLAAANGANREELRADVEGLHERFGEDLEMRVEIDEALWEITGDPAVRSRAKKEFQQLYNQTRRERFRMRSLALE